MKKRNCSNCSWFEKFNSMDYGLCVFKDCRALADGHKNKKEQCKQWSGIKYRRQPKTEFLKL